MTNPIVVKIWGKFGAPDAEAAIDFLESLNQQDTDDSVWIQFRYTPIKID